MTQDCVGGRQMKVEIRNGILIHKLCAIEMLSIPARLGDFHRGGFIKIFFCKK
jgi:hypothetical protein